MQSSICATRCCWPAPINRARLLFKMRCNTFSYKNWCHKPKFVFFCQCSFLVPLVKQNYLKMCLLITTLSSKGQWLETYSIIVQIRRHPLRYGLLKWADAEVLGGVIRASLAVFGTNLKMNWLKSCFLASRKGKLTYPYSLWLVSNFSYLYFFFQVQMNG